MNFKGKFEELTEATITRYQSGGFLNNDIVKIKPNALNHPKLKGLDDKLKQNIKMMMDSDLHITIVAIRSPHFSRGEMSDGAGHGTTTAPTDFWADIAVLHSPGLKSEAITVPVEVLERQDFEGNLPPTPDSLIRKGKINIKPEPLENLLPTKDTKLKESIEDIYGDMVTGGKSKSVTVRVPLDDNDEVKTLLDQLGITYSVVGTDRYELHGDIDDIEQALNTLNGGCGCPMTAVGGVEANVDVEHVGGENKLPNQIEGPPESEVETTNKKDDEESLEEAYDKIQLGVPSDAVFTVEVGNAFADNVEHYLTSEGVNSFATVEGGKTYIDIVSKADAETIENDIKKNVMGDLTYLRVYKSKSSE